MIVPPALCIAGMHRSGTSLISSLLQSGGLEIGQRLMGVGRGNPKGHYEDLDFNELHLQILESQGIHRNGFTMERELQIREQHALAARALVEERRRRNVAWGWKDPRSTLFLDFWQKIVPEANFLLLYRCPWDVVDSLFRRGDPAFRSNPSFAVRVWIHFNQLLFDFHDRFPERSLCVSSYRAAQSPELLFHALRSKFNLDLGPVADLYDASLLHRTASFRWASLLRHHFPEALDLYEQLNKLAGDTAPNEASLADEPTAFLPTEDWAFQDWLDLRVLEERQRECQQEKEKSEAELVRVRHELVSERHELVRERHELVRVRHELVQAQAQQLSLREELERARQELERERKEFAQVQAQLSAVHEQIANMQSSKFWKLRTAWMTAKNSLRRAG